MYYSDDIVNEVLGSNDIVDVISGYVSLKKSGKDHMGLCPFHREKTPSFHVSADKQLYHCFGCGVGGSVANFIMKAENLDFVEALKLLADRARIALPEPEANANASELYERRQRMVQVNAMAARYFYDCLISDTGTEAMEYFTKRKLHQKTIRAFGLGFAPNTRTGLIEYLKAQGCSADELVLSGLAVVKNDKPIDKFRNRIMFPIIDLRGNVIGFGGRVMDDSVPKYLNSPETIVFNKSKNLFALNFAKNAKSDTIILVEGYMDVISLHQAGITNTVATLGTAIGEDQAKLLCRYANQIAVCYDSDGAGKAAAMRAIDIISAAGGKARVITLLDAKDPDEYIGKHSPAAFISLIQAAPVSTRYKLNELRSKYNIDMIEEKIQFAGEAAKVLSALDNPIEIDAYANELSAACDIKSEALYAEIKRIRSAATRYKKPPANTLKQVNPGSEGSTIQTLMETEVSPKLVNAEKMLLNLICINQQAFKKAEPMIDSELFVSEVHKRLYQMIQDAYQKGRQPNTASITTAFEGEAAAYIASILCMDQYYEHPLTAVDDFFKAIYGEKLQMQIARETDPKRLNELLLKQAALKKGGIPQWEIQK